MKLIDKTLFILLDNLFFDKWTKPLEGYRTQLIGFLPLLIEVIQSAIEEGRGGSAFWIYLAIGIFNAYYKSRTK